MAQILSILMLALLAFPARPAFAEPMLDDGHELSVSKNSDEYFRRRTGDHFEWTIYQQDYSRVNYGHRFEWSRPGLSRMSVCVEVDSETGGDRYHAFAEEARCPKYETAFRWFVPFEGQQSQCEEFDKLTSGERYSRVSDNRRCAKPPSVFAWVKKSEGARPDCQEVDAETEGTKYRQSAREYLCEKTLNVQLAYGRKIPYIPSRSPASVEKPRGGHPEIDARFREDPEDLVDHVHRADDKIHLR